MKKVPAAVEAKYIDLDEETLRRTIGEFHENLVRLREEMKRDPVIVDLQDQIKERIADLYKPTLRRLEINLQAVRNVAKLKGVRYDRKFDTEA